MTPRCCTGRWCRPPPVFHDRYHRNLVEGFKRFQDEGVLEIITCGATHGFLPLMATDKGRRAQILVAKKNYEKFFGRPPRGIWLPECAYDYGIDDLLEEAGIHFFFVDSHGILFGKPRPKYGVFAPVLCPSNVAAFARDMESSKQVWSRDAGYPGDFEYREFYRDLGYDMPYEYIRPYLHRDGVRRNIGFKYHRITGDVDLSEKQPYRPRWARERAAEHAGNFMFNRQEQAKYLRQFLDRPPIIVSPYDAERPLVVEGRCSSNTSSANGVRPDRDPRSPQRVSRSASAPNLSAAPLRGRQGAHVGRG